METIKIDGVERDVIHSFTILHEGWDMDNNGWVIDDHSVWTTTCEGEPYEMDEHELDAKIRETEASLEGLKRAKALNNLLTLREVYGA